MFNDIKIKISSNFYNSNLTGLTQNGNYVNFLANSFFFFFVKIWILCCFWSKCFRFLIKKLSQFWLQRPKLGLFKLKFVKIWVLGQNMSKFGGFKLKFVKILGFMRKICQNYD